MDEAPQNTLSSPKHADHPGGGETITLAHGSGGKAMRNLIENVFVKSFSNSLLAPLEDQARVDLGQLAALGDRLAFATDSYVIDPIFFPGGDIGCLSVYGTVNDLAVSGATPLYLSCSVIMEEGLSMDVLRKVATSMGNAARAAGVNIVTGDTKVVPRGAADKLFINTAGIGVIPANINIAANRATPGDVILVNGELGNHGAAILNARGDLALDASIDSDCCPLNDLIKEMVKTCPDIHCLRDATRGGLATVLNEFAQSSNCSIHLTEADLPIRREVRGMCEILGLDPLYMANEGKLVAVVPSEYGEPMLETMREHALGEHAAIIGSVVEDPKRLVVLQTSFGGERLVDVLVGEQLPRIC
jgi:hydrogenase expression/formation protein HypE